jgi:elongation factor 1 alpha-like protein
MKQFLSQAGYASTKVSFVPCSGLSGENLVSRSEKAHLAWYSGPSLLQCIGLALYLAILMLESLDTPSRSIDLPLRLSISDISKGSRANVVNIVGRLESGVLQIGDSIISEPGGNKGSVRCSTSSSP